MRLAQALALGLALAAGSCSVQTSIRYDRSQLDAALQDNTTAPGLVIGEFPLADHAVVDGDTLRVEGLDASLRLLAIDTEETFKNEKDLRAYEAGFESYLAKKRGRSSRPVKAATPLGMEAKTWAEKFFSGVQRIRLERDHPKELRGRFGRTLAYVLVQRDGKWVNYNIECVRAGMSPYFSKYGYSRRFHDQFVQAQDEARAAGRGIWDPSKEHYPDYDVRLRWWTARADVLAAFEVDAQGRDNWIMLTHWDALDRLDELEGKPVVMLGLVGDIRPRKGRGPAKVMLSRRMFSDFPLIFFDDGVLKDSGVEQAKGEFVKVRGTVQRYTYRARDKDKDKGKGKGKQRDEGSTPRSELQIQINRPDQIAFINTRPDHLSAIAQTSPPSHADPPEVSTSAVNTVAGREANETKTRPEPTSQPEPSDPPNPIAPDSGGLDPPSSSPPPPPY